MRVVQGQGESPGPHPPQRQPNGCGKELIGLVKCESGASSMRHVMANWSTFANIFWGFS